MIINNKFLLISTNKNGDVVEDFIPDKDSYTNIWNLVN